MRKVLLILLVFALPLLAGAQSLVPKRGGTIGLGSDTLLSRSVVYRKWKMLDDSTVAVPLRDLQQTAIIRWTVDELREKARNDIHSMNWEIRQLRSALEDRDERASAYERVSSTLNESLVRARGERDAEKRKADKLRPWATVGKVGVVVVSFSVVVAGATALVGAAR